MYEINKNKTNYFIVFLDPFLPDVSDGGGDVELSSIEAAEEEALSWISSFFSPEPSTAEESPFLLFALVAVSLFGNEVLVLELGYFSIKIKFWISGTNFERSLTIPLFIIWSPSKRNTFSGIRISSSESFFS